MKVDLYNKLKINNEDKVIIIKNGIFYYCYFKDAYIIHYFKNYKLLGYYLNFPISAFCDIQKILIDNNIGYLVYDEKVKDISYGDKEAYLHCLFLGMKKLKRELIISKINDLNNEQFNKLVSICVDIGIKL